MKHYFLILFVGFVITNLTAQSYFDINFKEEQNLTLQTIEVTNLTKGINLILKGTDILRLKLLPSKIENVNPDEIEFEIYPNPMVHKGFIKFANPNQGTVKIMLHSLNGRLTYQNTYDLESGDNTFEISGIPLGVNVLTVKTSFGTYSNQIISIGNSEAQVVTTPIELYKFDETSNVENLSLINTQSDSIVELNFTLGDELYIYASTDGYVSQGSFVSPTSSQSILFLLTKIVEVNSSTTGKIWMDRNIGAPQVAIGHNYPLGFGDLFQWGRGTDGHEKWSSQTTSTLSNIDIPKHGKFITSNSGNFDWRSPGNDILWNGVNGINNPCPKGFRIPTAAEWNAERASWSSQDFTGAFVSPLVLTAAGNRESSFGNLFNIGSSGIYWSSTVSGVNSRCLLFNNSKSEIVTARRAAGYSVRCIKD